MAGGKTPGVVVGVGLLAGVAAAGEGEAGPVNRSKMAANSKGSFMSGQAWACFRPELHVQVKLSSAARCHRRFLQKLPQTSHLCSPWARAPPAKASKHVSINAKRRLLPLLPVLRTRRTDTPRSCSAADMLRLHHGNAQAPPVSTVDLSGKCRRPRVCCHGSLQPLALPPPLPSLL